MIKGVKANNPQVRYWVRNVLSVGCGGNNKDLESKQLLNS